MQVTYKDFTQMLSGMMRTPLPKDQQEIVAKAYQISKNRSASENPTSLIRGLMETCRDYQLGGVEKKLKKYKKAIRSINNRDSKIIGQAFKIASKKFAMQDDFLEPWWEGQNQRLETYYRNNSGGDRALLGFEDLCRINETVFAKSKNAEALEAALSELYGEYGKLIGNRDYTLVQNEETNGYYGRKLDDLKEEMDKVTKAVSDHNVGPSSSLGKAGISYRIYQDMLEQMKTNPEYAKVCTAIQKEMKKIEVKVEKERKAYDKKHPNAVKEASSKIEYLKGEVGDELKTIYANEADIKRKADKILEKRNVEQKAREEYERKRVSKSEESHFESERRI